MNRESRIIFTSGFYQISSLNDFGRPSFSTDYAQGFNLCFTVDPRISGASQPITHSGYVVVDKSGDTRAAELFHIGHAHCTIINFTPAFCESIRHASLPYFHAFFENEGIRSLLIRTSAESQHILSLVLQQAGKNNDLRLSLDILVMELLEWLHETLGHTGSEEFQYKLHKNHLSAAAQAKNYIYQNFTSDISLTDITGFCGVTPFYFARIFKNVTGFSLYQFLLDVRLKNAEYLVRNSNLHFGEIYSRSGFTSAEHFDTAFRKKFGCSPSLYLEKIPFFRVRK